MKKQFILFLIIFSATMVFSSLPILASEYSESHCPKIIKVEDNLGNVRIYNETSYSSSYDIFDLSFVKGTASTLSMKITAIDPKNLPLRYLLDLNDFGEAGNNEITDFHNWTTDNTFTIDVSKTALGPRNFRILIDNQDEYGCATNEFDTMVWSHYEVVPAETSCLSFSYSNWSSCSSNGQQTRSIISYSPNGCSGGNPALTQSCTYTPPICTSWIYSNWGVCINNQQTRTITSLQPANCTGGNPILNQSCNSTPLCTENNWTSVLTPTNCPSNGQQVKKWTKISQCQNGTSHSSEESVSCNYQDPTCTAFTYSEWGTCNAGGVQSRSTLSSSPSVCVGGNPVLIQSCNYNSSEVSNIETKNNSPVFTNNQNSQNDSTLTKNNEQEVNQEKIITSSQVVEQRKNEVTNAVQKIIQITEKDSEVEQQVKTIAQTQAQSQEKLETSLQKVQSRSGFAKFFVGPNYGEINNAKKLLEQNREQIKQLDEVQNQLTNKSDKQKLTEQVQLLEQTNQEIENSLNTPQKGFSLFGWFFRLFTR